MKGIFFIMGSILCMSVYQILYILTKDNFNNIMCYIWSIALVIAIIGTLLGIYDE